MIHFTRIEVGQEVNLYIKSTTNFGSVLSIFFVKNGDHLLKKRHLKTRSSFFLDIIILLGGGTPYRMSRQKSPQKIFLRAVPLHSRYDRESISRRLTS